MVGTHTIWNSSREFERADAWRREMAHDDNWEILMPFAEWKMRWCMVMWQCDGRFFSGTYRPLWIKIWSFSRFSRSPVYQVIGLELPLSKQTMVFSKMVAASSFRCLMIYPSWDEISTSKVLLVMTPRIHGTGMFTYIYHNKHKPNVGEYIVHGHGSYVGGYVCESGDPLR